jgi:hypothetical protein
MKKNIVMERLGKTEESDRSFDIEFWQKQDSTARFRATWEMIVFANSRKGRSESELRLQRTVESLRQRES